MAPAVRPKPTSIGPTSIPSPRATRPLAGIGVLDVSTVVGGPYAAHLLADLGASVIKVEGPGGDAFRFSGPARVPGLGSAFTLINRDKRSIAVDLKTAQGRDVLRRLIERADILLHNIRTPAARRIGLDYQAAKDANPSIIHAHIVGYDTDGPYGDWAAYEDLIQATAGAASLAALSGDDARPRFLPTLIADKVSGHYAASAILAALVARERFGTGAQIETPMLECLAAFLLVEHFGAAVWTGGADDFGYERMLKDALRPFRTADGYIGILPYSDAHWQGLLVAIGRQELKDDARLADHNARVQVLDDLYALIHEATPGRTTAQWLDRLRANGVPASPYNRFGDLLDDPHLRAVGFFQERHGAGLGPYRDIRTPVKFSGRARDDHAQPPRLGEHTIQILGEAGLSPDEIDRLVDDGVVKAPTAPVPGS